MAVDVVARAMAAGKVPVTAYEYAVQAGYTGTEEQFAEDMGNSGTNATNAANSATAAAASATTASNAAGNLAPAYSASATYAVGDHVLYDGGYYVCNTAITTAEAWTAAHWTAVKVGPEITDLKNALEIYPYETATSGFYRLNNATASLTPEANANYTCCALDCTEGDAFTINGGSYGNAARLYGFLDSSNNVLYTPVNGYTANNEVIIAPKNAVKLLVNNYTTGNVSIFKGVSPVTPFDLHDISANNISIQLVDVGLYKVSSGAVVFDATQTNYRCAWRACMPGDTFHISGSITGAIAHAYIIADRNDAVIETCLAYLSTDGLDVVIPEGASKIYFNKHKSYDLTINKKAMYAVPSIAESKAKNATNVREVKTYTGGYSVSSGSVVLAENATYYSAAFKANTGKAYKLESRGTTNKFVVYGSNDSETWTEVTGISDESVKQHNALVLESFNYAYCAVYLYYSSTANSTYNIDFSVLEASSVRELSRSIEVNGVPMAVYPNTSYADDTNGTIVNAYIQSGNIHYSNYGRIYMQELEKGYNYKAFVENSGNNRFVIYGSNNKIAWTEITRIANNSVTGDDVLYFNFTDYTYLAIQLYYNPSEFEEPILNVCVYKADAQTDYNEFTVNGIPVLTKAEAVAYENESAYNLKYNTVKLSSEDISTSSKNLCLVAYKAINSSGIVPNVEGYLYLDISSQKFYYSANDPYHPKYLFDWDASLTSDGETTAEYYQPTITVDGDVIFLRDHQRGNPIIYPHTDYTNPYIVDFGANKKPYAWLVGSSVVQFNDGSFVFGDYAFHSQEDEANDDRRIIWRVEKPYNNPSNWVQAHSFKHVYFTSLQSDEPDNEIGHIHAIMYDFYSDDLYCTTGDIDRHCRMWISSDHGETWAAVPGAVGSTENTTVQAAGQKWRMTNGVFTKDAMWWGTDAAVPYHNLWKCTRGENGHIDFSTLTFVADLEMPRLPDNESQRTYITALTRNPDGLLLLMRGEPRGSALDIKFYDFKLAKVIVVGSFKRAETNASSLERANRIGLPMQTTVVYEPETICGIVTGGGTVVRPNNTGAFNNSLTNYVGTFVLEVV